MITASWALIKLKMLFFATALLFIYFKLESILCQDYLSELIHLVVIYSVAVFVGIIAGLISAFVKWGAEHPFPPRSPLRFYSLQPVKIQAKPLRFVPVRF